MWECAGNKWSDKGHVQSHAPAIHRVQRKPNAYTLYFADHVADHKGKKGHEMTKEIGVPPASCDLRLG